MVLAVNSKSILNIPASSLYLLVNFSLKYLLSDKMHPDLFSYGESVLMVGEGNFSFAVGLINLDLSLEIVASCFESEISSEVTKRNIEFLKGKGATIFQDIDATKLADHSVLKNMKFDKIIFNFPHVGGKMKIHLNRELLKLFFHSSSKLLKQDGSILVSLCRGQGGTPKDDPARTWGDTWQVTEMAASADLILTNIESFHKEYFPGYTCVGYRSRDQGFHLEGALVHCFKSTVPLYPDTDISVLLTYLEPHVIETKFGKLKCPYVYASKYKKNPLSNPTSPFFYLCNLFKSFVDLQNANCQDTAAPKVQYIAKDNVPLCENLSNHYNSVLNVDSDFNLRPSLLYYVNHIYQLQECNSEFVIYSGLVFNHVGADFSNPPVSCQMLILGSDLECLCCNLLKYVLHVFNKMNCALKTCRSKNSTMDCSNRKSLNEIFIIDNTSSAGKEMKIAEIFLVVIDEQKLPVLIMYIDNLAYCVYGISNWRELWAQGASVELKCNTPVLRCTVLFPRMFTFDICLLENVDFKVEYMYDVLWQVAGDIIIKIELLNKYQSPEGWKTSCFRIVYQSFDRALSKKTCVDIHQNVIGNVLCAKLGVRIC